MTSPLLPLLAAAFALGILLGGAATWAGPPLHAAAALAAAATIAAALFLRFDRRARPAIETLWRGLPPEIAPEELPESARRRRAALLADLHAATAGRHGVALRALVLLAATAAGAAAIQPAHERAAAATAWAADLGRTTHDYEGLVLERREEVGGGGAPRTYLLLEGVRWIDPRSGRAVTVALPGRLGLRLAHDDGEDGGGGDDDGRRELDAPPAPAVDPALARRLEAARPGALLRFRARLRHLSTRPEQAGALFGHGPPARRTTLWTASAPVAEALPPDLPPAPRTTASSRLPLPPPPSAPLAAWTARTRHAVATLFDRAAPADSAAAPLLRAMVLGDTTDLPPSLRAAFARTGMAHLLAVSGLHASLLALVVYLLARAVGLGPRPTAFLVTAALVLYPVVVGGRAPILRAAVMTAAILLPWVWGRRVPLGHALALAALALLVAEPAALYQPGFQLSFLAVATIAVIVPRLDAAWTPPLVTHRGRVAFAATWLLRRGLVQPLWVVLAIGLALSPALAAFTHTVPLVGQLGNLAAVPVASVTVSLGFVAALVRAASEPLALDVAIAAAWLAEGLAWIVRRSAEVPAASVVAGAPTAIVLVAFHALLFAPWSPRLAPRMPWTRARTRAALVARLSTAALLLVWTAPLAPVAPGHVLEVTFLDVGQGDAIILRLPGGATILVDGGPPHPDAGRHVILPFLAREGIRRLDAIIATHGDADHLGGLVAVLEAIPVDRVLASGDLRSTRVFARWEEAARRAHRRETLHRGAILSDGSGARIFVLHPPPPDGDGATAPAGPSPDAPHDGDPAAWSANDRSIVLLVDYGATELLLPGDAGEAVDRALLALGWLGDVDVALAGHHGSRSSTTDELLEVTRPELVVISCGRDNSYGHPSADVLARLDRHGAAVWRTDWQGTLRLRLTRSGWRALPPP